jgi:hypothetical protein
MFGGVEFVVMISAHGGHRYQDTSLSFVHYKSCKLTAEALRASMEGLLCEIRRMLHFDPELADVRLTNYVRTRALLYKSFDSKGQKLFRKLYPFLLILSGFMPNSSRNFL